MTEQNQAHASDSELQGAEFPLNAIGPALFRQNAFRVLELPVDATARDIQRQAEMRAMREKFAAARAPGRGPLCLEPPPDADALREAMRRLQDPEKRLIDELFWFWPEQFGRGREDAALRAFAAGNLKEAVRTWKEQEKARQDGYVAMHNLAVLAQVRVLDLERQIGGQALSRDKQKYLDDYWAAAFKRWTVLLAAEGFWSLLAARIRDLDDPRLTTGMARKIRSALPAALLSINARLAFQALGQGATEQGERHLRVIRQWSAQSASGAGQSGNKMVRRNIAAAAGRALNHEAAPLRERVKMLCRAAQEEAQGDPATAAEAARRLLQQAAPLLAVLDAALAEGNPVRDGAHDEVALCALQCLIDFGNHTSQWQIFIELMREVLPLAAGSSARARIEENIKIGEGNLDHQMVHGKCWFCQKNDPLEDAAVTREMHGEVVRVFNEVRWKHTTVKVPRCAACRSIHGKTETARLIAGTVGVLAGLGGCVYAANSHGAVGLGLFGLILFSIFGILIGKGIAERCNPNGIKPVTHYLQHPAIKELEARGWKAGSKPEGVT